MKSEKFILLLQKLVQTPSFSREEGATAGLLASWLTEHGVRDVRRTGNNVWARNLWFDAEKPTIVLCSHHDTVRPTAAWTRDPFDGAIEDGSGGGGSSEDGSGGAGGSEDGSGSSGGAEGGGARLHGLGSNDAGASVVALTAAFLHFYERADLSHNLLLALVAEEEISGSGGARSLWPVVGMPATGATDEPDETDATEIPPKSSPGAPWMAIVGEPTGMRMATAEKGLMVLDCVAKGRAGHAARDEGENAIYLAIKDIAWLRAYPKARLSVTVIGAGSQHNVVPAECRFTVDARVPGGISNEKVLADVRAGVAAEVTPRSVHLRSSSISPDHPLVRAAKRLSISTFESLTTSDQVTLDIPSVKIGPGQSARSHTADEYVLLAEIEHGIDTYIGLLYEVMV